MSKKSAGRRPAPRPQDAERTEDSFRAQLGRLHERLCAHLEAISNGRESAADDLAVVLRTLMSHGQGDDVIARTVRRFGLTPPSVRVTKAPDRYPLTVLGFGGLPARDSSDRATVGEIAITEWADDLAIVNPHLKRKYVTWGQLFADYANTNGAHLSGTVPDVLGHVTFPTFQGRDLGNYLLWAGGSLVEVALRDLLGALDVKVSTASSAVPHFPILRVCVFKATLLDRTEIEIEFGLREEMGSGDIIDLPVALTGAQDMGRMVLHVERLAETDLHGNAQWSFDVITHPPDAPPTWVAP